MDSQKTDEIIEQIAKDDDQITVVLKGHIIIEEYLNNCIKEFVLHEEYIDKADISFFLKIQICRSISLQYEKSKIWTLIEKINTIRNKYAHTLDEGVKGNCIHGMKAYMYDICQGTEFFEDIKGKSDEFICEYAIGISIRFLMELNESIKLYKDKILKVSFSD